MTAQRIATNNAVSNKNVAKKEAINVLFLNQSSIKATTQRWVWVCEICGMTHSGSAPQNCDGCGSGQALTRQQDGHSEMGSRW